MISVKIEKRMLIHYYQILIKKIILSCLNINLIFSLKWIIKFTKFQF